MRALGQREIGADPDDVLREVVQTDVSNGAQRRDLFREITGRVSMVNCPPDSLMTGMCGPPVPTACESWSSCGRAVELQTQTDEA